MSYPYDNEKLGVESKQTVHFHQCGLCRRMNECQIKGCRIAQRTKECHHCEGKEE